VTITDNEIPIITSNGNKIVNNDTNKCGATVIVSATAVLLTLLWELEVII
jgi:hypothetical protein